MSNNNWQTDDQQWYSGNHGNSNDTAAAGYDIPMDNDFYDNQPQTDYTQYYGGGNVKPPGHTPNKSFFQINSTKNAFSSSNDFGVGSMSPSYWASSAGKNEQPIDEDEKPLLEELGINFDHIRQKTFAVLNPLMTTDVSVLSDNDLSGPLVFCLVFGFSLLLHGKLHFGYIYGIGLLGCLSMYALLNLMSSNGISLTCAVSVLGYCLLPMSLLSLVAAVCSFKGAVGIAVAVAAVLWCSLSASKLFVTALMLDKQRLLVAYPCSLFYGVFALLAIY